MPDIRDRVEQDRGLLKKIQLVIPGYAGYRRREDIRAAGNLLRIQLANQLKSRRGRPDDPGRGRPEELRRLPEGVPRGDRGFRDCVEEPDDGGYRHPGEVKT